MGAADTAAAPAGQVILAPIGHGDVLGGSANVDPDMARITTALSLLGDIRIDYDFDGQ